MSFSSLSSLFASLCIPSILVYNYSQLNRKKELLGRHTLQFIDYWQRKPNQNVITKILSNFTFWAIIETFIVSFFQYYPVTFMNYNFGQLVGTGANYFGLMYTVPLWFTLACLLFRIDVLKQLDLFTPAFPLWLVFVKLVCFADGCCYGFAWEHGIPNACTGRLEFPSQLLEAALALFIFLFLLYWKKRAKTGTMFPTYLILYSATRFFSEFTRRETNVLWILKTYHILCLIGILLGIIELLFVTKYSERISAWFVKQKK